MSKNYYRAAIILYAVQLYLLTMLFPSSLLADAGFFPPTSALVQKLFSLVILVLCFASVFLIRQMYLAGLRTQRHKLELQKIKNLEEQNSMFRQHRHDLYNHLTVISGMAQLGKLDRLNEYLNSYLDNINKSTITVNTGVKELDVLIYAKISTANSLGIEVDYHWEEIVQCSTNLVVSLITIVANSLDNAIRACNQAPGRKEMGIYITSDLVDYIFEVWNTYDTSLDLEKNLQIEGYTSKPGSTRGDGLRIMRRAVKRLHGNMSFAIEDDVCKLTVEIPKIQLEEKL